MEIEQNKPSAQKIRVEFEMDPEVVRELIEGGSKGPTRLSDEGLEELIKKGAIKAADYLDDDQMGSVAFVGPFVKKIGTKAVTKLTNKQTQKVGVTQIVDSVVDAAVPSERKSIDDIPKE